MIPVAQIGFKQIFTVEYKGCTILSFIKSNKHKKIKKIIPVDRNHKENETSWLQENNGSGDTNEIGR